MSTVTDWNEKALEFIRASFAIAAKTPANDFITDYLLKIKGLTMADLVLQVKMEGSFTAKVTEAIPEYLIGIQISPERFEQVLSKANQEVVYLPDLSRIETDFAELLVAMYSAVIIPLDHRKNSTILVLGWSAQQYFTPSFKSFLSIIREKMRERAKLEYFRSITSTNIDLMAAVFHKLPQAIVYIDDDGFTSWINFAAASLLQLPIYGKQSSHLIAEALRSLRQRASNNVEIEEKAREIFKSRFISIDQWLWLFDHPEIDYKMLCVSTRAVKSSGNSGRLWIFEDTTNVFC
jgi:hypothetical protein